GGEEGLEVLRRGPGGRQARPLRCGGAGERARGSEDQGGDLQGVQDGADVERRVGRNGLPLQGRGVVCPQREVPGEVHVRPAGGTERRAVLLRGQGGFTSGAAAAGGRP